MRQTPMRKVQKTATAQVLNQWQPRVMGEGAQYIGRNRGGEPDNGEIGLVDAHQRGRLRPYGSGIVTRMGAIRGADLPHDRTRSAHDVRYPKGTPNLDQFAA